MGLTIKNEGRDRVLVPEGTYGATCVSITDLGTQTHEKWGDKRKISVGFEIANETDDDGNPFIVYRKFNMAISAKSDLGKTLKSWLNLSFEKDDEFDLDEMLGKQGQLTIVHNEGTDGNVYANVDSVVALMKGTKIPKPKTNLQSFYLDESFDEEVFNELPEFIQTMISASPEYAALQENRSAKKAKAKQPQAKGKKR